MLVINLTQIYVQILNLSSEKQKCLPRACRNTKNWHRKQEPQLTLSYWLKIALLERKFCVHLQIHLLQLSP